MQCSWAQCYAFRSWEATARGPWQKETLNLQVGDFIILQDEAVETEGQPAVVTPGMRGQVISPHDGFHLDVIQGKAIPPKAIVQFEKVTLRVGEDRSCPLKAPGSFATAHLKTSFPSRTQT